MKPIRLFHQREEDMAKEKQEPLYDFFPMPLRVQISQLWDECFGAYRQDNKWDVYATVRKPISNHFWDELEKLMAHSLGVFSLGSSHSKYNCKEFLINKSVPESLSIIELAFVWGDTYYENKYNYSKEEAGIRTSVKEAIEDLNDLFRLHNIGYQLLDFVVVRVDSEYLHKEVVEKTSEILTELGFDGARQEFNLALDYHRKGETKNTLNESNKAFESTMKAICDERKWEYPNNITANGLIEIIIEKELLPSYFKDQLTGIKSVFKGLPTVRNKTTSAHGQGKDIVEVPEYFRAYAIHQTATTILLLSNAHKENSKPKKVA